MDKKEKPTFDLDELLPKIGDYGKYQKLMLWLICLPACIPCSFCAFNQLFMADVPQHWCNIPDLKMISPEKRRQLGIPTINEKNSSWDSCHRYAVNWTEILNNNNIDSILPNTSWPIESCVQGWEYNFTEVPSSIVADFNLVCDYSIYPTISLVILNIGSPVGVYIFGYLNDRLGRRISFFACLATLITGNVITAFSPNYTLWTISRLIAGLTVPAVYQIPFIIALELVGPNYRSLVTLTTCIFYTFGLILLSGITYLIRDWSQLALATSLPFLFYTIYWFYLPESPRWLLAKGQFEKASNILKKLAKVNKKTIPEGFQNMLNTEIATQKSLISKPRYTAYPKVFDLFRTPNMRLKTCIITFLWFTNITTYVGLSYYGPALGSNKYLSFFLSSIVEIPAYFACWFTMDKWGRRCSLSLTMILSGISSMATVLLPEEAVTTTLILFLIAKSAISASLLIIYPYAGEIFPTELRGIGIGTAAYAGGLGLIFIPFVTHLGTEKLTIPLVIMGALSVVGGISALRLPETLHRPLPQTVEEAEQFGKNWKIKNCCQCVQ